MGDKEKTVSQEVLDVFGARRIKNRFDIDVFNLRNSIKIMEEGDLSETKRKEVVLQMLNLFSKTDVRQEVFRDGDFFESLKSTFETNGLEYNEKKKKFLRRKSVI